MAEINCIIIGVKNLDNTGGMQFRMRDKIVVTLRKYITIVCDYILQLICGFIVSSHPEWNPRIWSNKELEYLAGSFYGNVVNVSAAEDSDKNGRKYEEYFPLASSYSITNFGFGEDGGGDIPNEKILDISVPYDGSIGQFDVVFNHTVIEHIPSVDMAIDNLCRLSTDIVITVVPFIQMFHGRIGSYTDYWRYTPQALINEFEKRGFSTVYISWNEHCPIMNVYILHIASKCPEDHLEKFRSVRLPIVNENGPGVVISNLIWGNKGDAKSKSFLRKIGEFIGCRMVT